jgi:hypothetical protein
VAAPGDDDINYDALIAEALNECEHSNEKVDVEESRGYQLPDEFVRELENIDEKKSADLRTEISKMRLPQRLKTALLGSSLARFILIRDPNQLIQLAVLKNPRITQKEIDEFAKNPNLSDRVLKAIAQNDQWSKGYAVRLALSQNPKAPAEVSMRFVKTLLIGDLRKIARSKNVPNVIATLARKIVESKAS